MKRILHGTALLATLVIAALTILSNPAFGADGGTVSGRVVDKTTGAEVGGIEVTLITNGGGQAGKEQTATTGLDGKFEFAGLLIDPANSYAVRVRYQDADYTSDEVVLTYSAPSQTAEVDVYDSTASDEHIQVSNGHLVIYAGSDVEVVEVWRFSNTGNLTYVGTKGTTDRQTLKFTLPAEATQVTPGDGVGFDSADGMLVFNKAVPPGFTDVSFAYFIPYQGPDLLLSRTLDYPVANFGLLVENTGVRVTSTALGQPTTQDVNGTKYIYFTGNMLAKGLQLDASISGVPEPGGSASGSSVPWTWLLVAVAALGLTVTLAYTRIRRRRVLAPHRGAGITEPVAHQTVMPADPEEETFRLLQEIARLDNDHQAGTISEDDYRERRAASKARLVKLCSSPIRQLHESSGG